MINKEHKDRLFAFIFGNNSKKEWTLSLYNAINGSDYCNPDDIEINTMADVVYMGMKNDVSFIVGEHLNLYAHQSTYNPNMPLRELVYLGHLYSKYIRQHKANIYGKKLIKLPVPKLIVFYNGADDMPDETILELKDAFTGSDNPDESDVNVRVRMLNVHSDKNIELLNKCRPLYEYSVFVDNIYKYKEIMNIEAAVDRALSDMLDDWMINDYLMSNKAEVNLMFLTEYNEEETMQMFREEGRIEGRFQLIVDLVNDEVITLEEAATRLDTTVEELKSRIEKES